MSVIEGMTSDELGFGANLMLWGFRASATGRSRCWLVEHGFRRALGAQSNHTLGQLRILAAEIGLTGCRKISLIPTPCRLVTDDELGLVAAISAATKNDLGTCNRYLSWLMATDQTAQALQTALSVGRGFADSDLTINMPSITLLSTPRSLNRPNTEFCGTA